MKQIFLGLIIAISMIACSAEKKEAVETSEAGESQEMATVEGSEIPLSEDSHVWYQGSKVVGGGHNGTVPISEGQFIINDDKLVGGEFTINISEIENEDIQKEESKKKFISHMKSEEFFHTTEYPTASFKITNVEKADGDNMYDVTGNLKIKDTEKEITFPATVKVDGEDVQMKAHFNINRTDFGVNYGSQTKFTDLAKDKAIKDMIELKVDAKSGTAMASAS